jgi:hypothetical protein
MHPQGWSMLPAQFPRCSSKSHSRGPDDGRFRDKHIGGTVLAFTAALLAAGCGPVYLSDTYATSTPRPESFKVGALAGEPVATLGVVARTTLEFHSFDDDELRKKIIPEHTKRSRFTAATLARLSDGQTLEVPGRNGADYSRPRPGRGDRRRGAMDRA